MIKYKLSDPMFRHKTVVYITAILYLWWILTAGYIFIFSSSLSAVEFFVRHFLFVLLSICFIWWTFCALIIVYATEGKIKLDELIVHAFFLGATVSEGVCFAPLSPDWRNTSHKSDSD